MIWNHVSDLQCIPTLSVASTKNLQPGPTLFQINLTDWQLVTMINNIDH